MPGKTVNKDVQVKNTEKYNQFIRVNLQVSIINNGQDGTTALEVYNIVKTSDGKYVLDGKEDLELEFTDHLGTAITVGNWIDGEDGYFYYIDNVSGGSHTNTLLNSVTLHSTAGNEYRGMNFNINVNAESVQASNDAVLDVWFSDVKDIEGEGTVLQSLKAKYAELQTSKTDSGLEDDEEIYESEDEDGKHIHKAPEETPGE